MQRKSLMFILGDEDSTEITVPAIQPFLLFQLAKVLICVPPRCGISISKTDAYNVPLGLGAGHVAKSGKLIFNIFLEPQFPVLHQGFGQPALQLFGGINFQF